TSTSTLPSFKPLSVSSCSALDSKRLSGLTVSGYSAKRLANVKKCCCASTVVGHKSATCRPWLAAKNAARSATSVLPKPTSPPPLALLHLLGPQTAEPLGCGAARGARFSKRNRRLEGLVTVARRLRRILVSGLAPRREPQKVVGHLPHMALDLGLGLRKGLPA